MTRENLKRIAEDPKTFLLRGRNTKTLISAKQKRIEEWRRRAESISVALKPGGTGGGSGYKQSIVENAVANIVDLENEILSEIQALIGIEKDVREAIDILITDDRYKVILELRYIHHLKLEEIAVQLNYAFRWVQKLNGQALVALKEAALRRVELVI